MQIVTHCVIRDGGRLLMLRKPKRGWWVVPGGKLEPGESLVEGVVREVYEETGLQIRNPQLRGAFTVLEQEDGAVHKHWMLFTFYTETFQGRVKKQTEEGTLEWVPLEELATRPMAEGDRLFLPEILQGGQVVTGKFLYTPDYDLLDWQPD